MVKRGHTSNMATLNIIVLVFVTVLTAATAFPFFGNGFPQYGGGFWNGGYPGFPGRYPNRQPSLQSLANRLAELEDSMERMEARECQTGATEINICDPAAGLDNLECIMTPLILDQTVMGTISIPFNYPFENTPVVNVGISGMTLLVGKNCTMTVTRVTQESFNLTLTVDQLSPLQVTASWMACPSAEEDEDPAGRYF